MIINLVSSPRNRSTLLMYSFAQRADTQVVDEPYYAHYLNWSGIEHPGHDQVLASMSSDITEAQQALLANSRDVLFVKNMAHHYREIDFKHLLDFTNVLYIRDPRAIIRSYSKVITTPTSDDIGIQQVKRIYDYLVAKEQSFLVLDSDDLITDPETALSALCQALGIPFSNTMLHWRAGSKPYDGIWAKHWYSSVHRSTGFNVKNTFDANQIELAPELETLALASMPAYTELKKHSININ